MIRSLSTSMMGRVDASSVTSSRGSERACEFRGSRNCPVRRTSVWSPSPSAPCATPTARPTRTTQSAPSSNPRSIWSACSGRSADIRSSLWRCREGGVRRRSESAAPIPALVPVTIAVLAICAGFMPNSWGVTGCLYFAPIARLGYSITARWWDRNCVTAWPSCHAFDVSHFIGAGSGAEQCGREPRSAGATLRLTRRERTWPP